jgi:hypothetical protein
MAVPWWSFFGCVGLLVLLLGTVLATFLILHFARRRRRIFRAASPPLRARAAAPPAPVPLGTTDPVRFVGLPGTVDYRPGPGGAFPAQVGRYRILGLLGAGGMGTVYRAHDPQLDREVALKFPRFDGPPEEVARRIERFRREARAAARVLHASVCPIFDVGEHEGRLFVVMALVEGESLAQRLAARGRYDDVREAVALIRQVLDGLAAIHTRGIVHRDLKPANILLDHDGRAVVTDFGLARPEAEAGQLTSEGVILGTPAYMAPEQAAGQSERIGPATDVYSLGVVLYQMLTGRPPFIGTVPAVLAQILRDEPPPPRAFRPDLDPALEAVLLRALRKDPAERYPDAQTFAKALDAWAAGAPPVDPPAKPVAAAPAPPTQDRTLHLSPARQPKFTHGRLAGWVLGGVVLTVSMGLLALLAWVLILGGIRLVLPLMVLAPVGLLLGLFFWSVTEAGYVPEGLLRFALLGRESGVRRALANGVSPDVRDEMGDTALMHAAAWGHLDVVKLLLRYGASAGLRNPFGQTALDMARAGGHHAVAAVLEQAGTSAGTLPGTSPRPDAAWGLLITAALGGLLSVGLLWLFAAPLPDVSPEEFLDLVEKPGVDEVMVLTEGGNAWQLEGKLTDPAAPEARRLRLKGGKVTAEFRDQRSLYRFAQDLAVRQQRRENRLGKQNLPVAYSHSERGYPPWRPPPVWGLIPMLGLPLLVAFLLGATLGGSHWFPVLGRPRRPAAATTPA